MCGETYSAAGEPGERLGTLEHRGASLFRLDHHGIAAEAEDLVHEPVGALEMLLGDHGAVLQLLDHPLVLARPARALGRPPDTRYLGPLDLAGLQPSARVGLDPLARLELLVEDVGRADPVKPEGARVVAFEVV